MRATKASGMPASTTRSGAVRHGTGSDAHGSTPPDGDQCRLQSRSAGSSPGGSASAGHPMMRRVGHTARLMLRSGDAPYALTHTPWVETARPFWHSGHPPATAAPG